MTSLSLYRLGKTSFFLHSGSWNVLDSSIVPFAGLDGMIAFEMAVFSDAFRFSASVFRCWLVT